jgi:hypothetical protein
MSTDNFFTKLIKRLKAGKRASPATSSAPPADEMMGKLIRMVEDTDEVEISCDDAFELLDRYVELEARGEDVAHLLPMVKRHLDRCRDCHEEYEALAQIFEATSLHNN